MEKHFIISDVAIETVEPVNILNIFTLRKRDPFQKGQKTAYYIDFYKSEPTLEHLPLSWKYNTEGERDCDYNKIVKYIAISVNELA